MSPTPLILVGPIPGHGNGGSRIVTQVGTILANLPTSQPLEIIQIGPVGDAWSSRPQRLHGTHCGHVPWPVYGVAQDPLTSAHIAQVIFQHWGTPRPQDLGPGILFAVSDPARAWHLLQVPGAWTRWAYLTIDGVNQRGTIGGPAAEAIRIFDRVLPCSEYASGVIAGIRGVALQAIPHGYDPDVFTPAVTPQAREEAARILNPTGSEQAILGCVAANQSRKDLSFFLELIAACPPEVRGWLHVDTQVSEAWSVPQLALDLQLDWRRLTVTTALTEATLAAAYGCCYATVGVGRGEGFGFPILESLACGRACFAVDAAAGAELIPPAWRLPVAAWQPTGPYGILRPVIDRTQAIPQILQQLRGSSIETRATMARTWSAPYQLPTLVGRWQEWFLRGLTEHFTKKGLPAHG